MELYWKMKWKKRSCELCQPQKKKKKKKKKKRPRGRLASESKQRNAFFLHWHETLFIPLSVQNEPVRHPFFSASFPQKLIIISLLWSRKPLLQKIYWKMFFFQLNRYIILNFNNIATESWWQIGCHIGATYCMRKKKLC